MKSDAFIALLQRYAAVWKAAWADRHATAPKARLSYEAQFLPAALELMETPPSPLPRATLKLLLALVLIALLWSVFGKVDVVAIASGKVIPSDRTKLIQSPELAIVHRIRVRDGQAVKAGEVLIELDLTRAGADRQRIRSELGALELQAARSQALATALAQGRPPQLQAPADADPKALADEQRLLHSEYAELQARLAALDGETAKRRAELETNAQRVAKLSETLPMARQKAEDFRQLVDKQFITRHAALEKEQTLLETQRDLAAEQSRSSEIRHGITQTLQERQSLIAQARRSALDQLKQAEDRASALRQERVKTEQRQQQLTLTAPVDGVVQQLAVHTIGGVVKEAEPLGMPNRGKQYQFTGPAGFLTMNVFTQTGVMDFSGSLYMVPFVEKGLTMLAELLSSPVTDTISSWQSIPREQGGQLELDHFREIHKNASISIATSATGLTDGSLWQSQTVSAGFSDPANEKLIFFWHVVNSDHPTFNQDIDEITATMGAEIDGVSVFVEFKAGDASIITGLEADKNKPYWSMRSHTRDSKANLEFTADGNYFEGNSFLRETTSLWLDPYSENTTEAKSPQLLTGAATDDVIRGNQGEDTLTGGKGNDVLAGGLGDDTYVYSLGDGQDKIVDISLTSESSDVLIFKSDILPDSITAYRQGDDMLLSIQKPITQAMESKGSFAAAATLGDTVVIANWFKGDTYKIEQIKFANGVIWAPHNIKVSVIGTHYADYLEGGEGNDVIVGMEGNDTISSSTGNDTLDGGLGNDELNGDSGNDIYLYAKGDGADVIADQDTTAGNIDILRFKTGINPSDITLWRDSYNLYVGTGAASDQITLSGWYADITARLEKFEFSDGTVWGSSQLVTSLFRGTVEADLIQGTTSADSIEGSGGNDTLNGDSGADTYLFGRGDGKDVIFDSAGTDLIQLKAGLLPSDVKLWRDLSDLHIEFGNGDDAITVQSWFDATTHRVESIKFADGTIWNATVLAAAALRGTSANETLYGTTGNNTLIGDKGDDQLYGDTGNDVYEFAAGDGKDWVVDYGGTDTIRFVDANVLPANLLVSRDANHLYLSVLGSNNFITVQNHFIDTTNAIESVQFADGTTWNKATFNSKMTSVSPNTDFYWGTTAANIIDALAGNDTLIGNEGNDTLTGGDGDDSIDGGTGSDSMIGGLGNDYFGVDHAGDTILELNGGGLDVISSTVTYTLPAHVENIVLREGFGNINATGNILANSIDGNSGDNILSGDAGDDVITGNQGNDTLAGGLGRDTLKGGPGNDTYQLSDLDDTLIENSGEGTDTVSVASTYTLGANLENLTLTGTAAINGYGNALNNTLTGNSANNILDGGAGNDNINGGTGADTLIGGAGNDTYTVDIAGDVVVENVNEGIDKINSKISYVLGSNLESLTLTGNAAINGTGNTLANTITGNSAANTLVGGQGADTLIGAAGSDTYLFTKGDGADLIRDTDSTAGNNDVVTFTDVASTEITVVQKSGTNLILKYGTTDQITVENYFASASLDQYRIEKFTFSDSKTWTITEINTKVVAAPPPPLAGQSFAGVESDAESGNQLGEIAFPDAEGANADVADEAIAATACIGMEQLEPIIEICGVERATIAAAQDAALTDPTMDSSGLAWLNEAWPAVAGMGTSPVLAIPDPTSVAVDAQLATLISAMAGFAPTALETTDWSAPAPDWQHTPLAVSALA